MVLGTLYYYPAFPRSGWLVPLAKYLQLEITAKSSAESAEFSSLFMLKRTPAFISENGFKLTEMIAIALYFVQKSDKKEFAGVTDEEKALQVKWLSFFNSDVITSAFALARASTEEEKLKSSAKLEANLAFVDDQLSKTKFLSGETPLVSDMFAYVLFTVMKDYNLKIENSPNIDRYIDELKVHPLGKLVDV
ncbi:hypothetical protein PMKS-003961 [Pichia membranifaciens]|uniref:GST C-terminal domain-containing protein n=1 Tax=Pichia membranifaciens TaxID=4926 RepID=A0A1Q2YLR0_9ASCO|nr:hypothetical protein PMKS-003961 [Pichia membranifaciens]